MTASGSATDHRQAQPNRRATIVVGCLIALMVLCVLGCPRLYLLVVDRGTYYAPGFSWVEFDKIKVGDAKADVHAALGTGVPGMYHGIPNLPPGYSADIYSCWTRDHWPAYLLNVIYDEHDHVAEKRKSIVSMD